MDWKNLAAPYIGTTSQSKTPKTKVKITKTPKTKVKITKTLKTKVKITKTTKTKVNLNKSVDLTLYPRASYPAFMFTPVEYTKWSDRLCFDIALRLEGSGEDLPEILSRHRITPLELSEFSKDPVFDKKVRHYRDEIRDKGITFRLKARAQAEELLTTSWTLIHNPDVSAAVKADLIKSTIKWAGLETKGDVAEGNAGGVSITINLGGEQQTMRLVPNEGEAEEIDGYADESV